MTTTEQDTIAPDDAETSKRPSRLRFGRFSYWRSVKFIIAALLLGVAINYGILGPLTHNIDATPEFQAVEVPENGSVAVATAAALIDRELNLNSWTPNDPWFAPAGLIDNMPNFQIGLVNAVGRFSFEMLDQIGRRSGSSSSDPDLEQASGFLQYPPNIWVWEPSRSLLPSVPSENQYRQGLDALKRYNARLARGEAVFERRADTLASALSRISDDLGSQTSQIERAQNTGWWIFSRTADDVFYRNKGMLYGYYVILVALGEDYAQVIQERNLGPIWDQTLNSLRQGSQLRPSMILNGDSDRSIFANHLALQGFAMKRAILQLEEVVSVLAI